MTLKLVLPSPQYKEQIMGYKEEFEQNNDSMDGTAGLSNAVSFEEWYQAWQDNLCDATVREGLVPATTFLAVDENNRLVGMIDIRHRLNDYLLQFGGHIGYSIRKSERRKGYATQMLALALKECPAWNIEKALVTYDKENIGSAKTICNNGGILENEVIQGDRITQRYWITVN